MSAAVRYEANDDIVRRSYDVTLKGVEESKRTIDFICSTEAIDSYGDVIEQDWNLARYLKNPVVLFGHDVRSLPIGVAEHVDVEGGALRARIRFVDAKANPFADQVFESLRQGSLRAISVGFRPTSVKGAKVGGRNVNVLSGNELMELSVVPVGANPDALALSAKSRGNHQPAKRWSQLSLEEKTALYHSDPVEFARQRALPATYQGKTWDELTDAEKIALHQSDPELFGELLEEA